MIYREIRVQAKGSSPEAHLTTYLLNTPEDLWIEKRPMVIVCPGGAYAYTSRREAEPVALAFNSFGYHAAVLEECARMALYTVTVNPDAGPAPQHYLDKHFLRKHGPNAYYGQGKE